MKYKSTVRLSQCMIVKNEEENIEKALLWGKDIVYEQIVVDTGSTDRTVELAKAMGAQVYHFQWIDDFSAAKNYAISKATGDWIAFLDADEYFRPEDANKLLPLLNDLNKTRYSVMMTAWLHVNKSEKIFATGVQTRIFKKLPGLRYINRIHELLDLEGENITDHTVDATEELAIFHTGYTPQANKDKQKGERNARLILMELENHPDDYDMMGYLADAYFSQRGNQDKAEEWYRKAIDLMPEHIEDGDMRCNMTFKKLLAILEKKNDEREMQEIYEDATKRIPQDGDFDYVVGKHYVEKKDFIKGAYHLERAISILEEYGSSNKTELLTGSLHATWELLAMCHYQNGDLPQCVKWCTSLLQADRYIMGTLMMLMCAFKQDEQKAKATQKAGEDRKPAAVPEFASFLSNLYDMNSLKDRIFLLRAAMQANYEDMVQLIRGTFSEEELACFDQAVGQHN